MDANKWTKLAAFTILDEALLPENKLNVSDAMNGCINIVDIL